MKVENEQTISGLWTDHEHYVFVAAVTTLKAKQIEPNSESILQSYTMIQQIVERDGIDLILSNKTKNRISGKLLQLYKEEHMQKVCGKINYLP